MSVQILKKLTPTLKEIRIHLCPRSKESNGVRDFISNYYTGIKSKNPDLPILVRECTGIKPNIWFRFEYGKETSASLENLRSDDIANLVRENTMSK